MKKNDRYKIGFVGLMQDNFGGCKQENFQRSIEGVRQYTEKLQMDFFAWPALILTQQEALQAAEAIRQEGVDFLVIQTTTFPDGNAVITLAKSKAKIGFWALPEDSFAGSNFIHSNNSFCGMNMAASVTANYLKDLNIGYKWFFGKADDPRFYKRFYLTVKALSALKRLASAKVALVGGVAPGFKDLYFDERRALGRLGLEIQSGHEFAEIQKIAASCHEEELEGCFACGGCVQADVSQGHLRAAGKYYRAYRKFCDMYGYDALALSCWPQIKEETLACSIIGKLNQDGIPSSCEGDLPGAVSMLLLHYITQQPVTLMDMCGFDEADESVLMWHCGPTPEFFADEAGVKTTCSYQLNLAGEIKQLGIINDLKLKPQPVTFMRITGEWDRMFLLDGQVLAEKKDSPDGSRGWITNLRLNRKEISALDLTNTILTQGFQHHYPMAAGDITEVLMECAAWLGLPVLEKVPYEDYLQLPYRK